MKVYFLSKIKPDFSGLNLDLKKFVTFYFRLYFNESEKKTADYIHFFGF